MHVDTKMVSILLTNPKVRSLCRLSWTLPVWERPQQSLQSVGTELSQPPVGMAQQLEIPRSRAPVGNILLLIVRANRNPKDSSSALTLCSAISSAGCVGMVGRLLAKDTVEHPGRTLTCRREVLSTPSKRPDNPAQYTQGWWFDLIPFHESF
ncbi:hypothetical protein BDV41DRAFT_547356 [Aspergillus transmontanensis]|uniref:Uncharacterized protein n=1 Tax=Aspergillus transmontanensis TaxID=1034304 RepID=A0A5N6VM86_9EURO|nr:hypothetical protein BDV41DRAFT_547356 [Aspergillus transmontanensis]